MNTCVRQEAMHIPLYYGLRKISKEAIPLRPIVSFVSSLTYNLSKLLARAQSPLVGKTASHVSSSTDFIAFTETVSIPQGFTLVSYNVISLFTTAPTDLDIEALREDWRNMIVY